jgi:hypothetical protein
VSRRASPVPWLRFSAVAIGACTVLHGQVTADATSKLLLGVVVDSHPQQQRVIEFERKVVESLTGVLAGVPAESFVLSYSDRVHPVDDWSPAVSGLRTASARVALDDGVRRDRGAVLNDGVMDGLRKLGASAGGDRKALIVIGEGNDGGSAANFSQILEAAKAAHIQCFALLVADHRSQVGRVRQFGFDLYRLASETNGNAYDVRTDPRLLNKALKDVTKRLNAGAPGRN